jgi:hypothetical protein
MIHESPVVRFYCGKNSPANFRSIASISRILLSKHEVTKCGKAVNELRTRIALLFNSSLGFQFLL